MAKTTAAADPAADDNKTEKVTPIRKGTALQEQQPAKPKSLASKLAALMAEVGNVPKNGWNDFHKYAYVKESDLAEALRGLFAKYDVMVFPSLEGDVKQEDTPEMADPKAKAKNKLTQLVMSFTFEDGETGETKTLRFPGAGEDKGDKGVYKAMTGAMKYFMMKTFQVSSNDDPENDEGTGNNNGGGNNNSGGDGNQQTGDPVQVAAPARYFGVQELPKANGNGKYKAHVFVVAFNGDKNNTATVQMFANANAPTQENVLEDISQKDADSAAIEKGVPCDAVVTKEGRYWNMVKYGPRQQQQQQQQQES